MIGKSQVNSQQIDELGGFPPENHVDVQRVMAALMSSVVLRQSLVP